VWSNKSTFPYGIKYFTSFIFQASRYSWFKFHKKKKQIPQLIDEFAIEIKLKTMKGVIFYFLTMLKNINPKV